MTPILGSARSRLATPVWGLRPGEKVAEIWAQYGAEILGKGAEILQTDAEISGGKGAEISGKGC